MADITRTLGHAANVALVEVTLRPDESVVVWGNEDDPAAPIDWSKRVEVIETFSRTFHTDAGIHVGSSIDEVMHAYGAVDASVWSIAVSRHR